MLRSERLRRARHRIRGAWKPGVLHAERRCVGKPAWWLPEIFGTTEWCEPTDETAEFFSVLGSLLADGPVPDDLVQLMLFQQRELQVGCALAREASPERWMLEAALNAWESWPGRTEAQVVQLLDRSIARAYALDRKGTT